MHPSILLPIRFPVYLSTHLFNYISIHPCIHASSIHLLIHSLPCSTTYTSLQHINLPPYLPIFHSSSHPYFQPSIYLSIHSCTHVYKYPSIYPPIHPWTHPFTYLFKHLPIPQLHIYSPPCPFAHSSIHSSFQPPSTIHPCTYLVTHHCLLTPSETNSIHLIYPPTLHLWSSPNKYSRFSEQMWGLEARATKTGRWGTRASWLALDKPKFHYPGCLLVSRLQIAWL